MFIDMDHRDQNYQQLININLFVEGRSHGFVVALIFGNGFIQDCAAFSYSTREDRVGESSQFKISCF